MRKLTSAVLSIVAIGSALGASTVFAAPRAAATYRGSGLDAFNNGPRWHAAPGAAQKISFRISKDGSRVLSFRGRYLYYCGAGSSTITAASLKIEHGTFGGTGKRVNRNGTNYFVLSGHFSADGLQATVTYLDDFVYKGKSVKTPYSFAYHSPGQACESRVTGTATAS
jgi:hypothetical protein